MNQMNILSNKSIRSRQMNQMNHFTYYTRLLKMGKIFIGILKFFWGRKKYLCRGRIFYVCLCILRILHVTSNFEITFLITLIMVSW